MKLVIHRKGAPPIEIDDADRIGVFTGRDRFELREAGSGGALDRGGLLVRLEEHDGHLGLDLAVFPHGGNTVRLRGGLE